MIAIALVGGFGTRLRPLTLDRPKPILPIAGRPFLAHLVERLARAGVARVVLSCGFRPDAISAELGDEWAGIPIDYHVEPEPLGTAGAIRFAALAAGVDEPFLALNGDVLATFEPADLVGFHRSRNAKATIALTPVEEPSRYGLVLADGTGEVASFLEKPGDSELESVAEPFLINAGSYVLDPVVLDAIPAGRSVSIEREVFPSLIGLGLYAWEAPGYWNDIGTPQSYLSGNLEILDGQGRSIAADARVEGELTGPCHVGAGAIVESGARVETSVIGAGSVVRAGASVVGSVLHDRVTVGEHAHLRGAVVGHDAVIGPYDVLPTGAIVGPRPGTDGEGAR